MTKKQKIMYLVYSYDSEEYTFSSETTIGLVSTEDKAKKIVTKYEKRIKISQKKYNEWFKKYIAYRNKNGFQKACDWEDKHPQPERWLKSDVFTYREVAVLD